MFVYTIVGGYILTSLLLFKYPTLIHRKKKIKFISKHISHRGGAGENYENTMCAFKRAASIGTQMLELDCHLTKDEEVVVCHDQNLFRSTGINKNIYEVNYYELPPLKKSLPIDFDPERHFVGCTTEEERKFPLLREVFEAFPQMPINIDIKVNDNKLIYKVSELIKKYDREEYTIWGNFNDEITRKCYNVNPNVNIFFSMKRVALLILFMYTGILPFIPLRETHLEIFLPAIYLRKTGAPKSSSPLQKIICHTVNLLLIRPCLFNHLKARGIHIYFWVLNREEEFAQAFNLGATGVMTDYPTKLKKFLDSTSINSK
ncbi:hypothetical protein PV328_008282 [Microctonus aethiopoides]|uniref:GP-PDE domain-containing protein n=2 Tax=Microctonus aethiopoides TaxID=144406 RepID=A0AA39CAG9_9HYME|nr:hypothetical protein PV328_008282 [Microctonus aethiopoides]